VGRVAGADPRRSMHMTKPYSWEREEGEATTAYAAFILFCEMGPRRSCAVLAERLGRPVREIQSWALRHAWRQRAVAFDKFCDGLTLKIRIRESVRIGQLQARKAARQTKKIVNRLASIDAERMSVLELIALLEMSVRLERECLALDEKWAADEAAVIQPKRSQWLQ
jgi:hypothetical protein